MNRAHLLGGVGLLGAAAWLWRDVAPDGKVALSTAIGAAVLAAFSGLLIDKAKTLELLGALVGVLRDVFSAIKAGSDTTT